MPELPVSDTRIHYVEAGQGATLVLVHGSLCDYRYWAPQMSALAQSYRVIALSLRYYWPHAWDGASGDFTIERHSADVADFIAALAVGPVHLGGHSRGGLVALRAAQRQPQAVHSLILAEPGGRFAADPAEADRGLGAPLATAMPQIVMQLQAGDTDAALERFLQVVDGPRGWSRAPEAFKQMARDNAFTLLGQSREPRTTVSLDELRAMAVPTLLIGGERSPPAFAANLSVLAQHLPKAQRVVIPRASHPMNVENATVFNRSVQRFVDALD